MYYNSLEEKGNSGKLPNNTETLTEKSKLLQHLALIGVGLSILILLATYAASSSASVNLRMTGSVDTVVFNGVSLLLLRHGKASHDLSDGTDDYFRPLDEEGEQEVAAMGSYLYKHAVPLPDLVVVSPSLRTSQTLQIFMKNWAGMQWAIGNSPFPVIYDRRIYDFNDESAKKSRSYIDIVHQLDPSKRRVLLVGHNPSIWDLAIQLTHTKPDSALHKKFPTASFASLVWTDSFFSQRHKGESVWTYITDGSAALQMFDYPKLIGFKYHEEK